MPAALHDADAGPGRATVDRTTVDRTTVDRTTVDEPCRRGVRANLTTS
ncbi:hypothetical protein I4I73_10585 [Pseudonocardia sp. KRD-184]|uniref:Uncharacterized protein n=1 Tax=Pseudonocardia oceani TaxID=2792013 RepID=A0ABS6UGB3_9PSEU|nr:hypothetical protein [Pseudonocardia oceani]MBW0089428.1 hypothetical protein [Pseudonocardia oceani]MBW0096434.1 hypothetical protein [Pseudonocardia oceani]MBW0108751.1 hypothetical protein [Pseudonocardia oceani]MBW0122979.1 hypothetical protein [Pseudonocardia oceani]MBW0131252.1 hypothetical protein [Pseudonocardia oceani]